MLSVSAGAPSCMPDLRPSKPLKLAFFSTEQGEGAMGERKGVKISGGIRKTEDARRMLSIMQKEGISTGNPNESRIGASSLLDDLIDGGLGRN